MHARTPQQRILDVVAYQAMLCLIRRPSSRTSLWRTCCSTLATLFPDGAAHETTHRRATRNIHLAGACAPDLLGGKISPAILTWWDLV